jgi:addiction module RelE/StbE family toxin
MQIRLSKDFKKYFKKRIPPNSPLEERYKQKVSHFIKNRKNPLLKDHKLVGRLKGYRAFSITGDIRVVYVEESKDMVMFVDIGTHNQVYS